MVKNLLLAAAALAVTAPMGAQVTVFAPTQLGEVNGVSFNGKYAAITDSENRIAYLWSADDPEKMVNITPETENPGSLPAAQVIGGADVYGVTDDGMVVGAIYYKSGQQKPAIYHDGKWEFLPMHPAAQNSNEAIAVTHDGSVIGGYMYINDRDGDIPGHYYPCRWVRNSDGEYDLTAYTDIDLPRHQGFYPHCMTPDGKIIAGKVYLGVGSNVPAWVTADGEFHMTVELVEKEEPWIYKGKYYCGVDENGKQIWSDDPEDPRIELFTESYIDGVKDDNTHPWDGAFAGVDWNGNFYGSRTVATDVDAEAGTGTLTDYAAMYNMESGEWTDFTGVTTLLTGLEGKILFGTGATVIENGEENTVANKYGIVTEYSITGVSHTSGNGQVLGGLTELMNPATGELQYSPMIAILEQPLVDTPNIDTGIEEVKRVEAVKQPVVLVDGGRINVTNAAAVAVYDLEGRLAGTGSSVAVAPGAYVVKADGVSCKVIVK